MPLIKLDSSATNGKPENFTTTFSNFVLEDNTEYEVAMVALSMNYSYPNVSVKNANNTVEYSPNSGTNFYTATIPDGNWSVSALSDYIQQSVMKPNGHYSVVNSADVFDITIQPNFNTGLVDIILSNNYQLRFTSSGFNNLLGFESVTLTTTSSSTKAVDITNGITSLNIRASIATSTLDANGNNSDIIFSFTPSVSPYSYITRNPTRPIYCPLNTNNQISQITMRITDNLNRDIDLRNEPVNYMLDLRKMKN